MGLSPGDAGSRLCRKMTPPSVNPGLALLAEHIGSEAAWAQVRITRTNSGFELRHVTDADRPAGELRALAAAELRGWAQFTGSGQFRPLRSAPTLRARWCCRVARIEEVAEALDLLYPASVADWYACRSQAAPPVTDFRQFTERQTGMYRITAKLSDPAAARVTRVCCHADFCLKQRLWTVPGLAPDAALLKSEIPCLEPCAVWLEFARTGMRVEQENRTPLRLSPSERATLDAALQIAVEHPPADLREGDVGRADHPKRLRLLLERIAEGAESGLEGEPETK